MDSNHHTIVIIGGGAHGTMALHDLLFLYEQSSKENPLTPPLAITWIDDGGRFGACDAFATNLPDCLLTNSPVHMVKPSLCVPELFHDYYRREHPGQAGDLNHCFPRRIYGEFLADLTRTLQHKAHQLKIPLHLVTNPVLDIQRDRNQFQLKCPGGQVICAQQVAVTVGPSRNDQLDRLQGIKGYIVQPSSIDSILKSEIDLDNPKTVIIGFGPGNSFYDGMALLENELGYKGRYVLVNPEGRESWSIGKATIIPKGHFYKTTNLTPDKLPCPVTASFLLTMMRKDISDLADSEKNPIGYGPEHPLYYAGLYAMGYFQAWVQHHKPDPLAKAQGLEAFRHLQKEAMNILKSVTAPQDIALYERVYAEKRLLVLHGRTLTDSIKKHSHYLTVPIRENDTHQVFRVHANGVMNCMPWQGSWQHHPHDMPAHLLHNLERQGLIRLHQNSLHHIYDSTFSLNMGLALLGASIMPLWGVHTMARDIAIAADRFVKTMAPAPAIPKPSQVA